MKLINKFRQLDVDVAPKFRKLGKKFERSFAKVGPRGKLFRKKRAFFGQIRARGAGWASARGEMTEGERIVLEDEGEGDSEDSDPVLVTGEASVGGSAGVSAGPSSRMRAKRAERAEKVQIPVPRGPIGRLFDESFKTS